MTRPTTFVMAFALVLCFGKASFAQHGRGFGGGFGGSAGKGVGGMSGSLGGEGKGNFGADVRSPGGEVSKGDVSKGSSTVTGKKTAGDLLTQNTKLSSNLQGLLPSGTNLQDAANGFDHLGQFVAAVHVSHNLGIPFDQLKTEMMSGNSLGGAIHKLKPNVDAKQEAIRANQQALDDMEKSTTSHNVAGAIR
jgi:hypothetical protein